jgi:alkyl hydroperoxide reductase subunit AhpC
MFDVGDEIPAFTLESQLGSISFREIIDGKWSVLITFDSSFDPVSTTDIGMLSKLADEFEARNIFVCAIGNDTGDL